MAPAAAHLAAGVPIGALGPEIDPGAPHARARAAPERRRRRADRGRGAVGRPLRQLPAQRRARTARGRRRAGRATRSRSPCPTRRACEPGRRARWVRTFARRQALGARRARRLLRHVHDRARPPFGGRRAGCARRQPGDARRPRRRSSIRTACRSGSGARRPRVRAGTSLVLVALLVADPARVDRAVRVADVARSGAARGERVRGPAAVRTLWGGLGGYVA